MQLHLQMTDAGTTKDLKFVISILQKVKMKMKMKIRNVAQKACSR